MGKGTTFNNDLLKGIFNADAITGLFVNDTGTPMTAFAVALHTADPSAGTQSTSEVAYTGYNRKSVNRNSGGWTVSGSTVHPAAVITFDACAGGSATATHWSVGYTGGGATKILYCGAISPTIAISSGITPQLSTATVITEA